MITADTLEAIPLFAAVPQHERETIAARAADVVLQTGEWLIHEGEMPSFFALLSGRLAITKAVAGTDQVLNTCEPGEYFGELPLLLNSASVAGLQALEPCRVLRLEACDFRELIVNCAKLSEQVLRTMAHRVTLLQELFVKTPVAAVKIIGHHLDLKCHDLREFFSRNHIMFTWLNPDDDATTEQIPAELRQNPSYPLVLFPDGSFMVDPSYRDAAQRLGLQTTPSSSDAYDVAIIGAGPAGLSSAVYGASEGLRTVLIEREAPGGQAGSSSRIENYLGFSTGISGDELSTRAKQQAVRFGAEMLIGRELLCIEPGFYDRPHTIVLDGDERIMAKTVVVATGVVWRKLEAEGVAALVGRGVYYGAGRMEALETRGKDVYLVGGGNSAGQAAMFFANYAQSVTLLVRGPSLAASMSQYLIDQLATKANVHVKTHSRVVAAQGDDRLGAIVVESGAEKERRTYPASALFILIGARAQSDALPSQLVRDKFGFVCTGRERVGFGGERRSALAAQARPLLLGNQHPRYLCRRRHSPWIN